jgi:predicted Kef-type K+ transport protein
MDTSRLLRSVVALVAVGLLAGALGIVLILVLGGLGLGQEAAYSIGAGMAVAVTLAIADTFTPIGSGPRDRLADQARGKLALDFGLTTAVAAAVGALLSLAGLASVASGLLVIGISVAIGYGTFVARNVEAYRPTRTSPGRMS